MPNHFHFLVKEITEGGISKFMEKITTGYSLYFNTKHKRSGALFQGTFKAQHVHFDEYLKYLYAYIHLNPVKIVDTGWGDRKIENTQKAEEFLKSYHHSSYVDYLGEVRDENIILSREEFPDYFSRETDFASYVKEWLDPPELT